MIPARRARPGSDYLKATVAAGSGEAVLYHCGF